MKKLIRVTEKELADILLNTPIQKGMALFASILQLTEPKLLKTNNPYKNVLKVSKVSIILNTDYEIAVTNQLKREDKDTSLYEKGRNTMPLTFGKNNQFIGLFKGEFVIQYRPNDNVKPLSKYIMNNKFIDNTLIYPFIPTTNNANQGTDRVIMLRKLYLKNVLKLTLNGITYKVIR